MDVKDVSNERWLASVWEQWERNLAQARRCKGQLVRDHPPAQLLVANHLMKLQMAAVQQSRHSGGTMATTQLPLPYAPCVRPASELEPIMIADMKLETHHRGKRVTIRVLTPPDRMTAVMAVVEDEKGTAVLLQSYYQPAEAMVPVNEIMNKGDVFIIKEPFFKTATDGAYTLRVDHLGDLLRLTDGDERIPQPWIRRTLGSKLSSKELRLQGNTAVKAMKWAEAHRLYTAAIKTAQTSEDTQLAHLNRSLTNMKLNRPAKALSDAEMATEPTAPSEKALFRMARAHYELGDFVGCLKNLEQLTAEWPENIDARNEMVRAKARIKEQETGVYSFRQMYKQAKRNPPLVDCATFSSLVEIRPSPGRGHGLFTTAPVSAGQLLVCEKAFGYSYVDESQPGNMTLMINMSTKKGIMGGHVNVLNQLIQKMHNDPRARDLYHELHHGNHTIPTVSEVDGHIVVDSFLVAQIQSLNGFGAPKTSREALSTRSPQGKEDRAAETRTFATTGIWLLASRINHSCVGNCRRSFIGDMLVIRAARDLEAGTELLWGYRAPKPLESYSDAQKALASWNFTCACELCLDRKQTTGGTLARRKSLHTKLTRIFASSRKPDVVAAKRILAQMEETYPSPKEGGSDIIRLELWDPYFALGAFYLSEGKLAECVKMITKGMESLGFVITATTPGDGRKPVLKVSVWGFMTDAVPWAFLHVHQAYAALAPELCDVAKSYAGIAYSILVGEQDTLGDTFPQLA